MKYQNISLRSFCFVTEFARDKSYPAEVERNDEQPQFESKDVSSQDNSDEDDEAALREQLLKSLAVKRKAKLDVGVTRNCDFFPFPITQPCNLSYVVERARR